MKQLIVFTLLIASAMTVTAQEKSLRDFIDDLKERRDVTHVTLQGSIFKLASMLAEWSDEADDDVRAVSNLSDGINRMEILDIDDYDRYIDEDEIDDLFRDMKRDGYEEMMTIRENKQNTKVYALTSKGDRLFDVAIVTQDRHDLTVIVIDGMIHMEDVAELMDEN